MGRNPMPVGSQKLITPRRSISTNDVNFPVWLSEFRRQIVQQVEDSGIVVMHIACPMIAQVMIQLIERLGNVLIATPIHNIQPLAGVRMK